MNGEYRSDETESTTKEPLLPPQAGEAQDQAGNGGSAPGPAVPPASVNAEPRDKEAMDEEIMEELLEQFPRLKHYCPPGPYPDGMGLVEWWNEEFRPIMVTFDELSSRIVQHLDSDDLEMEKDVDALLSIRQLLKHQEQDLWDILAVQKMRNDRFSERLNQ
jgi:hypothetical protein